MKQASSEITILEPKGSTVGSIKIDLPISLFIKSASKSTSSVDQL
jgi:hypothetical protein